jgi:hypothetical protein
LITTRPTRRLSKQQLRYITKIPFEHIDHATQL